MAFFLLVPSGAMMAHAQGATPATASIRATVVPAAPSFPTPIRHVIVIVDENKNVNAIMQQASYFNHLATAYAQAGQFYSVGRNSEPAYMAMTSGITPDRFISGGYNVSNVGSLATAAGETWGSYFEGMPAPCDSTNDYQVGYMSAHNPFVQYTNVDNNQLYCDSHVQGLGAWNTTAASGTIPNYAMIIPNDVDDMDNGTSVAASIATGNAWLQTFLQPILEAPWFSSTVVFITFDESGWPYASVNGTDGGHI
jgi:hypothetical protein